VAKKRDKKSRTAEEYTPPDAELEVLACLWQLREATARQIREMMHGYRPMAHGSVATLLGRLQEKGLVEREKGPVGKAFVYRSTRKAEAGYRRVVKNLHRRIFGGNTIALVTSLFETQPPTQDEIRKLERLLDELRRKNR
jgi:predicted transcriptional regulator